MLKALLLIAVSFNSYSLDFVLKGSTEGADSNYFNGSIETLSPNSWGFEAHSNSACIEQERSGCRKVGVQIDKGAFDFQAKRSYSFTFKLESGENAPEWLIIFQDWTRIRPEDTNGNHPITTLKVRRFAGQLYLQHWENSWQFKPWNFEPDDPDDYNHNHGLEVMRGEYKIDAGEYYDVSFDIHDRGWASLKVNGIRVSDAEYQAMSYTEPHINYFGMYWSKGFNSIDDYNSGLSIEILNLKYTVN